VFDKFNGSFAGEGNSEDVSQFENEKLFSSGVTVQILFADSGVVSVGLDHWV
jgi:hypothetical protein